MRTLLLLLISCTACMATPFLTCDSYPMTSGATIVDQPFNFTISGLGTTAIVSPAVINPDGSVKLYADLGPLALANGTYTASVVAVDVFGHPSPPATLTFPVGTPGSPAHVRVSPN